MGKLLNKAKLEIELFFQEVRKSNEMFFYFLFTLFVISNMIYMIGWIAPLTRVVRMAHIAMFTIVMWGSAIYLFLIIADMRNSWKRTGELIVIGVTVFIITGIISKVVTSDSYAAVMGIYFCLMVKGKNYKKTLYIMLSVLLLALLIGLIGLPLGITFDAAKPNRIYGGHSLGILYPNNWGFLMFAVMMIAWYLWLKSKRFATLLLFWAMSLFMYKYITCLTIAGLTFIFPVLAAVSEVAQEKNRKRTVYKRGFLYWIIVLMPFLVIGAMLLLCSQMDFIHDHFYGTPLESLAMRFVEGGYSLKLNGVGILGRPFKQWEKGIVDYQERIEMIIDSAFIAYLILRGILWMIVTLFWLSFAHIKAIKRMDYHIITISVACLIFSMMERPGLDVWYNFVLLYPLAALTEQGNNQSIISKALL